MGVPDTVLLRRSFRWSQSPWLTRNHEPSVAARQAQRADADQRAAEAAAPYGHYGSFGHGCPRFRLAWTQAGTVALRFRRRSFTTTEPQTVRNAPNRVGAERAPRPQE